MERDIDIGFLLSVAPCNSNPSAVQASNVSEGAEFGMQTQKHSRTNLNHHGVKVFVLGLL